MCGVPGVLKAFFARYQPLASFAELVFQRSRNGVALQKFIDDGKLPLLQQMYKDLFVPTCPTYVCSHLSKPGMETLTLSRRG